MALFRAGPFAPVRSGSWAFAYPDHPDVTLSGWYWDDFGLETGAAHDPVTGAPIYNVHCHNFDGAAYDVNNVVAKLYTMPSPTAIAYGPGKTQDPALWQTISLPYSPYYLGATTGDHQGVFTLSGWPDNTEMVYIVVEADGEPVLSIDGIPWTGDEYVVVDTPLVVNPTPPAGGMTCMMGVDWAAHVEDPDSLGLPDDDRASHIAQSVVWIDWGDGHVETAQFGEYSDFGFFTVGGGMSFHAYTTPGTYTVRVHASWYGGTGMQVSDLTDTILPTLLGTFTFLAVMPAAPVFTQRNTMYTLDLVDRSLNNPLVKDNADSIADEYFGEDYLLMTCPFTAMRAGVTPNLHKTIPTAATFHQPYAREETGYRTGFTWVNAIFGVDRDVVMRRSVGALVTPHPPVTEYGAPDYSDKDYGYYTHGDGPNPTKWRLSGGDLDNYVGDSFSGPYYFVDYLPKTREGGVSSYVANPSAGFEQQRIQCFNVDTGALTRSFGSPHTPDVLTDGSNSFDLPEAYFMYGNDEVLWQSRTGALWRHNHNTGVSRLIGQPFHELYDVPNNSLIFAGNSPTRFGLGRQSDGFRARITNVSLDGSITLLVYSRPDTYVPDPTNFAEVEFGGFAWWAFMIDRGGRIVGEPRRISESRYVDDMPWHPEFGQGWFAIDNENMIVTDSDQPIVYVPCSGRVDQFFGGNVYQGAVCAVDLVTGQRWIAIWLGHPWVEWHFDATAYTPIAPATFHTRDWDVRWLEPNLSAAATNLPPGTYQLRKPPGGSLILGQDIVSTRVHFNPRPAAGGQ